MEAHGVCRSLIFLTTFHRAVHRQAAELPAAGPAAGGAFVTATIPGRHVPALTQSEPKLRSSMIEFSHTHTHIRTSSSSSQFDFLESESCLSVNRFLKCTMLEKRRQSLISQAYTPCLSWDSCAHVLMLDLYIVIYLFDNWAISQNPVKQRAVFPNWHLRKVSEMF